MKKLPFYMRCKAKRLEILCNAIEFRKEVEVSLRTHLYGNIESFAKWRRGDMWSLLS